MALRRDPIMVGALLVAAAAVVVGLVVSAGADEDRPVGVDDTVDTVALQDVDDLRALNGRRVTADDARVESVPADEGFWVTAGSRRVWVQLTTAGESPFAVETGEQVSFTGEVAAHDADFADRPEFSATDAEQLVDAGAHVEVDVGDLRTVGS